MAKFLGICGGSLLFVQCTYPVTVITTIIGNFSGFLVLSFFLETLICLIWLLILHWHCSYEYRLAVGRTGIVFLRRALVSRSLFLLGGGCLDLPGAWSVISL